MNVILLKNVDNLGAIGDVVSVKRGYARNYLIPKGLAAISSESQQRQLAEQLRQAKHQDLKRQRSAEELAERYRDLSCTVTAQAGEDDKLFGSVSTRDIAAALTEHELDVDHRQIELEEPIKELGVYSVPLKLHPQVTVALKVWVVGG